MIKVYYLKNKRQGLLFILLVIKMCLYKRKLRSRIKILIVLYRKNGNIEFVLKQLVKNSKAETTIMSSVGLVITCLIILDTNLVN